MVITEPWEHGGGPPGSPGRAEAAFKRHNLERFVVNVIVTDPKTPMPKTFFMRFGIPMYRLIVLTPEEMKEHFGSSSRHSTGIEKAIYLGGF